jgi:hypothetical protein
MKGSGLPLIKKTPPLGSVPPYLERPVPMPLLSNFIFK